MKDYYDIKRPTVVQFTMINNSLKVKRYDLLSDIHQQSAVKLINLTSSQINLKDARAIPHPSNNSVFLVEGSLIYQFDNQNEILV